MLKNLVRRRSLWSIRIFRISDETHIQNLSLENCELLHVVEQPSLRSSVDFPVTIADPCLHVHGERMYLFYEVQTDFGPGQIFAQSMSADETWECHGRVLQEPFHLSFPNVFEHDGRTYMLPEAADSGKVILYEATSFPTAWRPASVLVEAPLLDPVLLRIENGFMLLATTRDYRLQAYVGRDLFQPFRCINAEVTRGRHVSRNAGQPIVTNGEVFRVTQNCQGEYGRSVGLSRITGLTDLRYAEELVQISVLNKKSGWMSEGYHSLSTARLGNRVYLAIDGRRKDLLINNYILAAHKVTTFIERRFKSRGNPQSEAGT